jgi:hypothetical protein
MNLLEKIKGISDWVSLKQKQQILFPVDVKSQQILNKDMLVATGNEYPIVLTDLLSFGLEVTLNGVTRTIAASLPLKSFTAAVTDICTYTRGAHGLVNGDTIALVSSGVLPAGLDTTTIYFIINATATTFKVSLTSGGSAVDITDTGTGTHYFGKL